VSFDTALLFTSGGVAILAGMLVLLLGPTRSATLLSGFALLLLGLNQLGWSRTVYAIAWTGRNQWFELSLGFSMALTFAWLLLSVVLGRGKGPGRGWRYYIASQALLSLSVIALAGQFPPARPPARLFDDTIFPLTGFGKIIFAILLINVWLVAANFEATYLGLSLRGRRLFRAGLSGVLICAGCYGYFLASTLWTGHLTVSDLYMSALPVTVISLLLPIALIRGRIAEATVGEVVRPVYKTKSLLAGVLVILGVVVIVQLTRATGWSLVRTLWVVSICVILLGLPALALSDRTQRRVQWALESCLRRGPVSQAEILARLTNRLESVRSIEDLIQLIPANAEAIAGVKPVTLFLADRPRGAYVPVGSTLHKLPTEPVGMDEPLPRELRKTVHAIPLRGRPDDLEYIPIYVENGKQISACAAVSAVPLSGEGELLGFLLCGDPEEGSHATADRILLLGAIARHYSARLELLTRRGTGPND
jgi:hypothetical protein